MVINITLKDFTKKWWELAQENGLQLFTHESLEIIFEWLNNYDDGFNLDKQGMVFINENFTQFHNTEELLRQTMCTSIQDLENEISYNPSYEHWHLKDGWHLMREDY